MVKLKFCVILSEKVVAILSKISGFFFMQGLDYVFTERLVHSRISCTTVPLSDVKIGIRNAFLDLI